MYIKFLFTLFMFAISSAANAEVGRRAGPIEEIQAESSERIGYEGIIYIKQSGAWTATDCPTSYAYYDSKTNPQFTSILLAAKLSNQSVYIGVESTKPRLSTFCQIINIYIR